MEKKQKKKKFFWLPGFWDLSMIIKYDLTIANMVKKFFSSKCVGCHCSC